MVKGESKKHVLTAFSPNGDYAAILSANGTAKVSSFFLPSLDMIFVSNFAELFPDKFLRFPSSTNYGWF